MTMTMMPIPRECGRRLGRRSICISCPHFRPLSQLFLSNIFASQVISGERKNFKKIYRLFFFCSSLNLGKTDKN